MVYTFFNKLFNYLNLNSYYYYIFIYLENIIDKIYNIILIFAFLKKKRKAQKFQHIALAKLLLSNSYLLLAFPFLLFFLHYDFLISETFAQGDENMDIILPANTSPAESLPQPFFNFSFFYNKFNIYTR